MAINWELIVKAWVDDLELISDFIVFFETEDFERFMDNSV